MSCDHTTIKPLSILTDVHTKTMQTQISKSVLCDCCVIILVFLLQSNLKNLDSSHKTNLHFGGGVLVE